MRKDSSVSQDGNQSKSHAVKEPLFHIVKRDAIPWYQAWTVRIVAVIFALAICAVLVAALSGKNPLDAYKYWFEGALGSAHRRWNLFEEMAILLCISLAVTPAFKMQFWNIGAEGQALMGGLATAMVMFYLGGKVPYPLLIVIMTLAALIAGAVWAIIPAIFKAKWNTNETLFTLMMNYIAMHITEFFIKSVATNGTGKLLAMTDYKLPKITLPLVGSHKYLLNIVVVIFLTVIMFIYLKYSKQGYEISVVGQSQNTARYIGIDVKKVFIRTMIISGIVCGLTGLLLVGGASYTVASGLSGESTVAGRGFTAIMVSWLGKFNPFYMMLPAFLIAFFEKGAGEVETKLGISDTITDIVTGIILFCIIGCEFFLNYKIVFRHKAKEVK